MDRNGALSARLKELAEGGFIDPDPGLNPETGEEARVSRYRLRDNYTRFYLKYIEPRKGIDAKGGVCRRDQAPERDRRRDREGGRGADEASAAPARNEQAPRVGLRRTCRSGRRGRRILLRDHPRPQAAWDMTCFMAGVVDDGAILARAERALRRQEKCERCRGQGICGSFPL